MPKISRSRLTIIILIVVIFVLLIFFDRLGLIKPVKSFITFILKPVESPLVAIGSKIDASFQYFKSINELEQENKSLKNELEKSVVENIQLKNKIDEMKILEKEWEFVKKYNYTYVSGKLIGKVPDNQQILIFNKGKNDGLKNGLPAITENGILVGKVIEVNNTTAKIMLLIDSQSQIAAMVQNNDKIEGVIKGEHGLSMKMTLIPQDKIVKQNDWVVTSGLESYIPAGLVIGQIDKVLKKPGDLFQEASITSATSYEDLQILTVITS